VFILELAKSLESQPFAAKIAESTWLFPFLETGHVLFLAIVVGSIGVVDFRLLGLAFRARSVGELTATLLPWTWTAFAGTAACGVLLFASRASSYYANVPFRVKIVLLGLAAVNMIVFHWFSRGPVERMNHDVLPRRAKVAGAISLSLWIAIVAAGRWIGFSM
jgi:hypothetical protein